MDDKIISLRKLPIGKKCAVIDISSKGKERNRMLDLGIVKNTIIEALQKSPSGDPVAYFIKGTVIALRNEDAKQVLVKILK